MNLQEKELQAISSLHQWGVSFLSIPCAPQLQNKLEVKKMLACLIDSNSPRLNLAVTAFFLVHPEQAKQSVIFETISELSKKSQKLFKLYYTAAVYLQALWKSQLAFFGTSQMQDYFSQELKLPDPHQLHGRLGLAYLEDALQQSAPEPYHYQASFDAMIKILLDQRSFS